MRPYQKPIRTAIGETLDLLADSKARIKLLETHLRRVLEAGKVVRQSTYLPRHSLLELQNYDQAAGDAEGVLHEKGVSE